MAVMARMLGADGQAERSEEAPALMEVLTRLEELRTLLGEPGERALKKDVGRLDEHCRAYIARSPFALIASSGAEGRCDVSPRGDVPGFALVLDEHTLVLPERPGNRRFDTLGNLLCNPEVGLLFLIPGSEHTLRVNGRARLARDRWLLERMEAKGKLPLLAVVVDVREAFFHCAKAFRRANLWDPETFAAEAEVEPFACILHDQVNMDVSLEELSRDMEARLQQSLY